MPDEMNTRLLKTEWKLEELERAMLKQNDRISELFERMESHHKEQMGAIGSFKDDRARSQGAAEARLHDSQVRQNRLKWMSFGLAALGTLFAIGWIGEAKAVTVNQDYTPPIIVQHHSRGAL